MAEISPSILAANHEEIVKEIYKLETVKSDYIHIDVMDNEFVPNKTDEKMLEATNIAKTITNIPLDVHLMVKDIDRYIEEYIPFKPMIITFHLEACRDNAEVLSHINKIKENRIKVGISIKPATPVEDIFPYLDKIHMVLIMSVEPGFGGQKFMPIATEKISKLKKYIGEHSLDIDIEVDGGITADNAEEVKLAGANVIVAGTAVFKPETPEERKEVVDKIKK